MSADDDAKLLGGQKGRGGDIGEDHTLLPAGKKQYTSADLAEDMHSLTAAERQKLQEDIHGVADRIEETEDFLKSKLSELRDVLASIPAHSRSAWDRAVFLRPGLSNDRQLHLTFLRALHFDSGAAATRLVRHLENKRNYFGDDLLIHRITWNDLNQQEQSLVLKGVYRIIRGQEATGRSVAYSNVSLWDVSHKGAYDPLIRAFMYVQSTIFDNPQMQIQGLVAISDLRGNWTSSPSQVLEFLAHVSGVSDDLPFHMASNHVIYDDPRLDDFLRAYRPLFEKEHRLRTRFHFGPTEEIEKSLRTFGINLRGCTHADLTRDFGSFAMEQDVRNRQELDEKWRQIEAPYRLPTSQTALFPNPQDIILGRNKSVATTWPGNVTYRHLIANNVQRYLDVHVRAHRFDKTVISLEVLHVLQRAHGARFLSREETFWKALTNAEAQHKVGRTLRAAVKSQGFGTSKSQSGT